MSRKGLGKSFLEEEAGEKEIPGYIPWSNPNELQATDRNSRQGPKEEVARHEAAERHPHKHRHHRHTHRKRHLSESSDRHEAASNMPVVLSDEREQIERVTDGHVPWSNRNELQAVERNSRQGPGTSGTRRKVFSARQQDASPGAEALSMPGPGRRHPVFLEEERPGAVVVPGIDSDGLTIEEGCDEQSTMASNEESTVHVFARAVDTEEENRMRREHDQAVREQDRMRHELDQAARQRDQLLQMLDNAPILTPVIATRRDVENGDEKVQTNHFNLAGSDDHKCGKRGKQWFAMIAILLIVVAVAVTLALVLPPEPNPPQPTTLVPNTQEPTTISPTAEPTTPQDSLSKLISSASPDGGLALADPSTPQSRAFTWLAEDPNLASYTDQQKIEHYALATLYYTTNGDSWNNNDYWLSYEDVCGKWYNNDGDDMVVDCTSNGSVSIFRLSANNLQGVIPPEIGMLSDSLVALDLASNELHGTLPTEIGELTKLTILSLGSTRLVGTIPSVIGLLTNLEELWLEGNALSGDIPTEIGNLIKLSVLRLCCNSLMGDIGTVINALPQTMTYLSLYVNLFAGTIPPSIGMALTDLDLLDIGINNLSGKIPTEVGLLNKLTYVSLMSNQMTGTIPSELGLLTKLTGLILYSNQLTGTVPTSLASLPLLRLNLAGNDLTGSLDAFCTNNGDNFESFVANTCGQDGQMNCTCCSSCCDPNEIYCDLI